MHDLHLSAIGYLRYPSAQAAVLFLQAKQEAEVLAAAEEAAAEAATNGDEGGADDQPAAAEVKPEPAADAEVRHQHVCVHMSSCKQAQPRSYHWRCIGIPETMHTAREPRVTDLTCTG